MGDLNAGPGWYEWIAYPTATTHAAYIHEGGNVYLPDGEFTADDFLLAAAEGRAHRLVRVDDLAAHNAEVARKAKAEMPEVTIHDDGNRRTCQVRVNGVLVFGGIDYPRPRASHRRGAGR